MPLKKKVVKFTSSRVRGYLYFPLRITKTIKLPKMKQSNPRSNNKHLIVNIYLALIIYIACFEYLFKDIFLNSENSSAKWFYFTLQLRKPKFQNLKLLASLQSDRARI